MKANNLRFDHVYSEHQASILNYVRARVHNPETAEEITQDVFVRVAKHLSTFDETKAQLNTWLFTITNRIMIDYFRADKSAVQVNVSDYVNDNGSDAFQFEDECNTDQGIDNANLRNKLEQSFASLKGMHRRIAEMYLLNGKQYDEIAQALNVPIGTVKGTLNRAKAKLQTMLGAEYSAL